LIGWLVDGSVGWLVGWLVGPLVDGLVDGLVTWLVQRHSNDNNNNNNNSNNDDNHNQPRKQTLTRKQFNTIQATKYTQLATQQSQPRQNNKPKQQVSCSYHSANNNICNATTTPTTSKP